MPSPPTSGAGLPPTIDAWIGRWTAAGLIDAHQADAIRSYEAGEVLVPAAAAPAEHPRPRAMAIVAEVLAYIGAVLALAGVILVVIRAWQDLAPWVRLTLPAAVMIALLLVGAAIPVRGAVQARVRAVVWLAASGATAVLGAVFMQEVVHTGNGATIVWGSASLACVVSLGCWRWQRRPLQQAAALIALAIAVGTGVAVITMEGVTGFALWPLGALYLVLGVTRRTPDRLLTEVIGAVVVFAGTIAFSSTWTAFGMLVMVGTALIFVALAVSRYPLRATGDAVVFGVAGLVILLQGSPGAIGYFAQDAAVVTGLVVWGVGAAIIVVGASAATRLSRVLETAGGFVVLIGAAVTGAQAPSFATLFGLATAALLLIIGTVPGRILLTLGGSLGLLIFVPWTISWYFPGANRAPLLIAVSGVLVLLVALMLGRSAGRFRDELSEDRSTSAVTRARVMGSGPPR